MKAFVVIVLILIGVFVLAANLAGPSDQITLRAAPGAGAVQLFGALNSSAAVLRQLPDGTSCAKLEGPKSVNIDGVTMSFYKVNCKGVTGYVNARYVR